MGEKSCGRGIGGVRGGGKVVLFLIVGKWNPSS